MSSNGDHRDNAVAERFFRSLKTEYTNRCIYNTREAAKQDVIDYIEMFYYRQWLQSYLGYQSPKDYQAMTLAEAA